MRILVVEDDAALREDLRQRLAATGFGVDVAADGEQGLFAGLHYPLDAAIVDIGLPKKNGIEVVRELRAHQFSYPIIMLTGRNSWQDRVEGLGAGANDYVGKPFYHEEVIARVQSQIRCTKGWFTPEIVCGPYALDMGLWCVKVDGVPVDLTTYEYRLLELLMLNAGRTLSVTELTEHMYREELERESNVVAQLIRRLRRKLDPMARYRPIETAYGGGYRFVIPRGPVGTPLSRPKSRW
jgi:two-component system response regulator PhoP